MENKPNQAEKEKKGRVINFPGPSVKKIPGEETQAPPRLPGRVIDFSEPQIVRRPAEIQRAILQQEKEQELDDIEDEIITEEEDYTEQLALEQEITQIDQQLEEAYNEGKSYKKPSKIKYFILFGIAAIIDIIDLLELTGVGLVVTTIVSLCLSVLMLMIFWLTNTKQKSAQNYGKKLEFLLKSAEKNIAHIERRTVQAARFLAKRKFIRNSRLARKGVASVYKIAKKNPVSKYAVTAVANLIPILGILPWQIIGVWLSYRDEKESLRDANKAADQAFEQSETLAEAA